LDSLLTFFLNDELDKDTIGQTVKDDFAMAKNTLNQSGHRFSRYISSPLQNFSVL
jgi:hypothetical protein